MTKPSEQDVDRLLKSARLQPPAGAADVCLDAETLAAWADGTLSDVEYANAERHAADCARCQALLAAMVRTAPSDTTPVPRWSPWRVARWAVPLSAAAAVALWFAVDGNVTQRQPAESVFSGTSQSAATQSASAPPAASPPPSTIGAAPSPASPAPSTDTRRSGDAAKTGAPAERDLRKETPARSPLQDLAARKDVPPQPGPPETERRAAAVPPSAPPVPPTEGAAPPSAAPAAPAPPPPSLAETVIAPQSAQKTVADAAAAGPSQVRLRQQVVQSRARTVWIDVASPEPLVKWRFSAGLIEQSTDGGVTWTRQPVGSPAAILAGVAPSSSACWLVGSGGLVLRFTTARGWQRLVVPNAPDLVAVEAKDADNATVTLANGQRLTTSDGGATWR